MWGSSGLVASSIAVVLAAGLTGSAGAGLTGDSQSQTIAAGNSGLITADAHLWQHGNDRFYSIQLVSAADETTGADVAMGTVFNSAEIPSMAQLVPLRDDGNFATIDEGDASSIIQSEAATVIPAPGSLALLGLAGLILMHGRRR
jgi:hypothetical protein